MATQRQEVLITHDPDFTLIHGALYRFAHDHRLTDIHAGILIGPRTTTTPFDTARLIDAFFAAQLPITDLLYKYQSLGSWVMSSVAFTYP